MDDTANTVRAGAAMPEGVRAARWPSVFIVVLNWRDGEATLACLAALAATTYPNFRVVVVDNASADGSADRIARLGTVDLLRNPTNLGFTGGVNVGIGHAMAQGADYIWLLNSDAVTRPDVLSRLVAVAESDSRIGLVSPVFHDAGAPHRAEFCLGRFDPASRYATQTDRPEEALLWQRDYPDQVILVGTALLVRRALVEAIGALDTRLFAYVEDVDFCLRSTRAGFRNVAVPDAVVLHSFKRPVADPASCPPYLHYFMTRNYLLLWKTLPRPFLLRKAALWFLRQRLVQIERMAGDDQAVDAVLAGLWDGVRGIGGAYDPSRRIPLLLRRMLGRHPGVWINLLDGKLPGRRRAA
ncbi:MAG TPA: glycosyltransferase family 2 protein [Acetobacteraceae bacterium]